MTRVVVRGFLSRRMRAILTGIAIALGVALMSGTYILTDTIDHSFASIFTAGAAGRSVVVVPHQGLAVWIPISAGVIWSLLSFALVRYWSAACGWRDIHRWAISFGAVLGSMALGDASAAGWTHLDLIAKFVFQLLAVVGFVLLARKVWQRDAADHTQRL